VSSKSDDKSEKPQTTNEQEVGNESVYNKSDNGSSAKQETTSTQDIPRLQYLLAVIIDK
jgi:hypothetical protein